MVLKFGRSEQQVRNTWKVLKCGAGEEWRRSVGPIMWEMMKCYLESTKRKANWSGHILCRNCLLKQVNEGKIKGQIEVTRRQGRRRKKLLDDLKDRRGYCELMEEALDRTVWWNRFARGFGPVVWQITDNDDDDDDDDDKFYIFLTTQAPLKSVLFHSTWLFWESYFVLNLKEHKPLFNNANKIFEACSRLHTVGDKKTSNNF